MSVIMKPSVSLLLIYLSLTSAFQGRISEFSRLNEKRIKKHIGLISHLGKNKEEILVGQRGTLHKNETEESNLSKDFEIDGEVVPKEGILGSYSLINFRQRKGEVIMPCFGMWWPVGGNDVVYEYTEEDDGGEYKKKRKRRVKKQKRTSKAKKRKRS